MKYFNMNKFSQNDLNDLTIVSNNKKYDLHSDAEFIEIDYNIIEKKIFLVWRYPSNWFLKFGINIHTEIYRDNHKILNEVREIKLIFDLVSYLQIIPRDSEIPYTEDKCLSDIIVKDGDDFKGEKIIFEFQSGMKIIIKAESITFNDF